MNRKISFAIVALAAATACVAFAQSPRENKPATKPATPAAPAHAHDHQLPPTPPGWTDEEWGSHLMACHEASVPGPMHEFLAQGVGVWHGKNSLWMYEGAEPMKSECVTTTTALMDGRFFKSETSGEMPGMGPFIGFGLYGFDNATQKFQSTWIDNCGTGMMTGTGDLSSDGTTLTWNYLYNCPSTKKPQPFRIVERHNGKDSFSLEMHTNDMKTGKEFKLMQIDYTRKTAAAPAAPARRPATTPGTR
jgi:hypothetical protein